jgi:hypothetical protein
MPKINDSRNADLVLKQDQPWYIYHTKTLALAQLQASLVVLRVRTGVFATLVLILSTHGEWSLVTNLSSQRGLFGFQISQEPRSSTCMCVSGGRGRLLDAKLDLTTTPLT